MNPNFRRAAVGIPGFCAFFNLYGPQSLLPSLAREFDATPAQISLTMTATTLAIALSAPFAGAIADMLGRKRVIVAAMIIATAPLVMIALAPNLHALILWRFVLGLALPPIFTVVVAYIGEEWPPAQSMGVMGVYMAATSVGGFAGRLVVRPACRPDRMARRLHDDGGDDACMRHRGCDHPAARTQFHPLGGTRGVRPADARASA